jgi:lysophospholipase L1-like esterase
MNWETYIAFGDSITIGARTYLGYPELVGHLLSEKLNKQWNIINHAVSGYKAIELARYIDAHYSTLKDQKASVSSILIGTNDIKENTSLQDFEIAVNQIVLKVKLLTENKNVILLEIPEFPKGIMYPYSFEMNGLIALFNLKLNEIGKQHHVRVLKLNFSDADFIDGVHLNDAGIKTVAHQLTKYILKDKGIDIG